MNSRSFPQKLIILLVSILVMEGCIKQVTVRNTPVKLFNDGWEFYLSADSSSIFPINNRDVQWQKVTLPHTPVIEPLVVTNQWQGICWYRKNFFLPENMKDKRLYLKFDGAMNVAEVWINGVKKITHEGGYLPFVIDFSAEAKIADTNQVIVRLDNRDNPITGPKPLKQLDFNMYGGIYRNVYLIAKNSLHITDPILSNKTAGGGIFVTYPEVTEEKALIRIKTQVKNEEKETRVFFIKHELWFANQLEASSTSREETLFEKLDKEITQELTIPSPHLWFPDSPELYKLVTKVVADEEIMDTDTTRIGIRRFDIKKDYFAINGKKCFLRGVNRHQEYPYIGYALSDEAQYRDARKIKEAGFDYVRLSHYPQSPAFMDACDELGLVVLDDILGWQYFSEDSAFQSHVVQTCHDLIRRDRNHACVMAWEVSLNESWMPENFIDRLVKAAHEEYPGDQCFTAGWQYYGYDIYLQARQHRLQHYEVPDKPYIVSEYGDWEYYAMNAGLNQDQWDGLKQDDRSSRQLLSAGEKRLLQQATNIQEAHNDNLHTPAFADGYWAMFDYNRGYSDDLESSGIMSITRLPKFSYYFFQSQRDAGEISENYQSGPMVFIASYWNEQSALNVRIFSNCEEVELSLNGKIIGKQLPDSNSISDRLAHPPFTFYLKKFEPGTLIAKGFIDKKEVAHHTLRTPEKPESLELIYDESGIPPTANSNDAIFVYARIIDKNGTVVPLNGINVKFTLRGDAEIINPSVVLTEAGIASALVKIGVNPGEIEIFATSDNLDSARQIIEVSK